MKESGRTKGKKKKKELRENEGGTCPPGGGEKKIRGWFEHERGRKDEWRP